MLGEVSRQNNLVMVLDHAFVPFTRGTIVISLGAAAPYGVRHGSTRSFDLQAARAALAFYSARVLKSTMTARFITFEGGEGSGKSTQARLLTERLRVAGQAVLPTREPGGSPFAEAIRELILGGTLPPHQPLAEALLFYAARADHLTTTIRPALAAGTWVLCDRFSDSTRVYQGLAGNLELAIIDRLEEIAVAPTRPDLTLIVDVPVDVGLARAGKRRSADPADPYERREAAFHQRLRDGFLAIARAEPQRCAVIDGTLSEAEVAAAVWAIVEARLIGGSA